MMKLDRTAAIALVLSISLLGALACGGSAEGGRELAAPVTASDPRGRERQKAEPEASMCDLLSAAEVDSALGSKLPLGPAESIRQGCRFPVRFGVDGNALSFSRLSRGNYDAYRGYEQQSSVEFEFVEGIGLEAFVLNNAQVCVLLGDDEALLVGAQVIAFQEELPITQEEMKQALIEIAEKVVRQL